MQVLESLIEGPLRLRNRREGDELIGMIVRYLSTGEEPQPRTDAQEAVLVSVWPVLETSRARRLAGISGGSKSPSKQASKSASKAPSKSTSKPNGETASNGGSKAPSKQPDKRTTEEEEELGRGMEEEEQEKKSARKARGFVRPTVEEVREYCASKGYPIDAEEFCSYYESNGWKVGRNPMRSWKGACTTWAKRRSPRGGGYAEYSQYD